jgi:RHS repeat-associated protein
MNTTPTATAYVSRGLRGSTSVRTTTKIDCLHTGPSTYSYSGNGELSSKTVGSDVTHYNYDAFGNLRRVVQPDGTLIEYVVDGMNRRVGKKVNGVLVQGFLYEGKLSPIVELDGAGNVVSRFVYGTRTNVPDYVIRNGATYRIVADHLGSVRLVVETATGAVAEQIDYDVWGNVLQDSNPGFQPFGYAGGLFDNATRLIRFGARDYDPEVGRWTGKDPVGFIGGSLGLYTYVDNDPIAFADPKGLCPEDGPTADDVAKCEKATALFLLSGTSDALFLAGGVGLAMKSISAYRAGTSMVTMSLANPYAAQNAGAVGRSLVQSAVRLAFNPSYGGAFPLAAEIGLFSQIIMQSDFNVLDYLPGSGTYRAYNVMNELCTW